MESVITTMLAKLGVNLKDENFKDTPERVAKALRNEIYAGLVNLDEKIDKLFTKSFPAKQFNSIILFSDIKTFSMCPHHLIPIEYEIDIAYLPSKEEGKVIGLSKPIRLAELLSARPVLQETLTEEIASTLMSRLNAAGVGVVIKAAHLCMRMRGVKAQSTKVLMSTMLGAFRDNASTRQEFFELLAHSRR